MFLHRELDDFWNDGYYDDHCCDDDALAVEFYDDYGYGGMRASDEPREIVNSHLHWLEGDVDGVGRKRATNGYSQDFDFSRDYRIFDDVDYSGECWFVAGYKIEWDCWLYCYCHLMRRDGAVSPFQQVCTRALTRPPE